MVCWIICSKFIDGYIEEMSPWCRVRDLCRAPVGLVNRGGFLNWVYKLWRLCKRTSYCLLTWVLNEKVSSGCKVRNTTWQGVICHLQTMTYLHCEASFMSPREDQGLENPENMFSSLSVLFRASLPGSSLHLEWCRRPSCCCGVRSSSPPVWSCSCLFSLVSSIMNLPCLRLPCSYSKCKVFANRRSWEAVEYDFEADTFSVPSTWWVVILYCYTFFKKASKNAASKSGSLNLWYS